MIRQLEKSADQLSFELAGHRLFAHRSGALFVPEFDALIVSDLHFEKGSAYARSGQMLPPYDTRETLRRLGEVVEQIDPACVIALGDSFHDLDAAGRMSVEDRGGLKALVNARERWIWIEGNHDPEPPEDLGGEIHHELRLGNLVLRHEPEAGAARGEICGHLHPCAKVRGKGRAVRRFAFATNGDRLIMPAFGAYTGGLNVCDDAIVAVFGEVPSVMVLGREQVHAISPRQLVPDRYRTRTR
ncbi:ligase-associated DNA damage response endonuclease PdeM [Maricaulis sp.]|uniref:ligase-associated DNA damage response endonuclease PdeM n=1 Tax=unclassified Maricaulis TaxID=2632371 RepID=UPI001B1DAC16|nr:ligase-associated DNA damage response endonuclease PdeM [Maricaulis sp.]MBO6796268.1 ligase-associated DNA damage response endonuclease PdeM [Maricaulis sp.]